MPRVLVAGCGYVGQATADLFNLSGWAVEGWTATRRSADILKDKPYPVRAVDLSQRGLANDREDAFDAIIHCASSGGGGAEDYRRVYLAGARNLVAAFPDVPLLFTSSTSVYAQRAGEWVDENSSAEPERETGRILRETEELVLAHRGIVARLGGIYGPGRSALLQKFLSGQALIDPENDRWINQVHRDDIATALFLLVTKTLRGDHQRAEIYNVVDGCPFKQTECYTWLAGHLGLPLPRTGRAREPRKRGDSNKRVRSEKLRNRGWGLRYPTFAEAMAESILPSFGFRAA